MTAIIPSNARTEKRISNSDIIVSCIQGMSMGWVVLPLYPSPFTLTGIQTGNGYPCAYPVKNHYEITKNHNIYVIFNRQINEYPWGGYYNTRTHPSSILIRQWKYGIRDGLLDKYSLKTQ